MINLEDGSRLSGDEAPQKKDLEKWLDEHPGYMIADCDEDDLFDVTRIHFIMFMSNTLG